MTKKWVFFVRCTFHFHEKHNPNSNGPPKHKQTNLFKSGPEYTKSINKTSEKTFHWQIDRSIGSIRSINQSFDEWRINHRFRWKINTKPKCKTSKLFWKERNFGNDPFQSHKTNSKHNSESERKIFIFIFNSKMCSFPFEITEKMENLTEFYSILHKRNLFFSSEKKTGFFFVGSLIWLWTRRIRT